MNFEKLLKLEDIATWITSYADKARFISDTSEAERRTTCPDKEAVAYMLKLAITYNEIIDDYLRLIQDKANELNELVNYFYAEYKAQKVQQEGENTAHTK